MDGTRFKIMESGRTSGVKNVGCTSVMPADPQKLVNNPHMSLHSLHYLLPLKAPLA